MSEAETGALAFRYASTLAAQGFAEDPAQRLAVSHLDRLRADLVRAEKFYIVW